jgi:hypothetical protein
VEPTPDQPVRVGRMTGAGIVVQLNAHWRVVLLSTNAVWTQKRAWSLQELVNGEWQGRAIIRAAGMLRSLVTAWCGDVDGPAAAILAALPARVDLHAEDSRIPAMGRVYRNRRFPKPKAPPAMASRDCVTCGSTFTYRAQASRTLTCSPKCSRANQRARQRVYVAQRQAAVKPAAIATAAPPPPEVPAPPLPEAMERAPRHDIEMADYWKTFHGVRL